MEQIVTKLRSLSRYGAELYIKGKLDRNEIEGYAVSKLTANSLGKKEE